MHTYFNDGSEGQHSFVLHGLAGTGKTQIALKFISESSCFTDVFFIDASTSDTLVGGLKNLAGAKNSGGTYLDALHWLSFSKHEWLILFDNANPPMVNLAHFLPRCNHGNILITSRSSETCLYASSHSLVSAIEDLDRTHLLSTNSRDGTHGSGNTASAHSSDADLSTEQGLVVFNLRDIDEKCIDICVMLEDCKSWATFSTWLAQQEIKARSYIRANQFVLRLQEDSKELLFAEKWDNWIVSGGYESQPDIVICIIGDSCCAEPADDDSGFCNNCGVQFMEDQPSSSWDLHITHPVEAPIQIAPGAEPEKYSDTEHHHEHQHIQATQTIPSIDAQIETAFIPSANNMVVRRRRQPPPADLEHSYPPIATEALANNRHSSQNYIPHFQPQSRDR
ncbi:hypothetical protein C8R45DRAFT_572420 [Mycena sanguinolenta]|nr:hypothetical protein C8R45DRAFT_572420 [Mycena sanguinolenta]